MISEPARQTYHGLDALRGIAAFAVLCFHAHEQLGTAWLAGSGYLAVDLFFVMSGFVVAHSYEARIPQFGISGFMKLRLIRFLPLFYLGGVLGLVRVGLLAANGKAIDVSPLGVLAYFLFLPAPPSASPGSPLTPLNGPGWSLLLEIYINLLYALLLPVLTTRVLAAIVGAAAAGLLISFSGDHTFSAAHWSDSGIALLRVTYSFSLGLLLFRLRTHWQDWTVPALLPLAVFWLSITVPSATSWDYGFTLVVSPLLTIAATAVRDETWLARFGAQTSYAIYAVHLPLLLITVGLGKALQLHPAIAPGAVIAAMLVIATPLDRLFDRPIRRRLIRRFGPSQTSRNQASR